MILYFLLFAFSWIVSFFCSGYEAGFLSVSEFKINALAKRGNKAAKIMAFLLKNKEKVLTTLLVGNMISLVLLTFSFGKIIHYLFSGGFHAGLQTLLLTVLVFISCELFPKSLFRIYSFELTYRLSFFVLAAYVVLWPISWFFSTVSSKINGENASAGQDYRHLLHDVAAEGARRRLLPLGVSVLVSKFNNKDLCLRDICQNVKTTGVRGRKNVVLKLTQPMEEIIKSKLLFNCDTVECRDANRRFYYPTTAILDAFFRK